MPGHLNNILYSWYEKSSCCSINFITPHHAHCYCIFVNEISFQSGTKNKRDANEAVACSFPAHYIERPFQFFFLQHGSSQDIPQWIHSNSNTKKAEKFEAISLFFWKHAVHHFSVCKHVAGDSQRFAELSSKTGNGTQTKFSTTLSKTEVCWSTVRFHIFQKVTVGENILYVRDTDVLWRTGSRNQRWHRQSLENCSSAKHFVANLPCFHVNMSEWALNTNSWICFGIKFKLKMWLDDDTS